MEEDEVPDTGGTTDTGVNEPLSLEDGRRALHVAAAKGDAEEVKKLLGLGALADMPDNAGNRALHYAAREGHVNVVTVLLDYVSDLNIENDEQFTPLCLAIEAIQREVLKILLIRGAKVNAKNVNWCSILMNAVEERDEDFCKIAFKSKVPVDLNEATKSGSINVILYAIEETVANYTPHENQYINTAFQLAVSSGKLEVFELFLTYNVDLEYLDHNQNTPLLNALINDRFEIAVKLLEKGVNVDAYDGLALRKAAEMNKINAVNFLLIKNANLNAKDINGMTPLHFAVGKNNLEIVKLLIQKGAEINTTTTDQNSPLHTSIQRHHNDMTTLLLENKALLDSPNFLVPPLYLAVQQKQTEMVKLLIEKGADLSFEDSKGETLLSIALNMERGSPCIAIANILLDAGASVEYSRTYDESGRSLLHLAVWLNDINLCRRLLEKGVPIDSTDHQGNTPVVYALLSIISIRNDTDNELIYMLIDNGADLSHTNISGYQAINSAVYTFQHQLVELLIEKGALERISENRHLYELFRKAFARKHYTLIHKLIDCDLDLNNLRDEFGSTLLHLAAFNKNPDITRALIRKGVNVNTVDNNGSSPLHAACKSGSSEVVESLLENGADMNVVNSVGKSPVHIAKDLGTSICKPFIKVENFVDHPDPSGEMVCHILAKTNNTQLMKLYLSMGNWENVNIPDMNGNTALYIAVKHNKVQMVKFLLKNGANIDIRNNDGDNLLHLAAKTRNWTLSKILLKQILAKLEDNDKRSTVCYQLSRKSLPENVVIECDLINSVNSFGKTPLHLAVDTDDAGMVQLLINSSADVNARDMEELTPLLIATKIGNRVIIEKLLENGAITNFLDPTLTCTMLNDAIRHNFLFLIESLLKSGVDINEKDRNGDTALHTAAAMGSVELVLRFLDDGADVNAQTATGNTALHQVAEGSESAEVGQILIAHGAKVDAVNLWKQTPLLSIFHSSIHPISDKCIELVKLLLENGANPVMADLAQRTPLNSARFRISNLDIQDLMYTVLVLEREKLGTEKFECLKDFLKLYGRLEWCLFRINRQMQCRSSDQHVENALLMFAMKNSYFGVVESMLTEGVDCNKRTREYGSETPLTLALNSKDDKLLNLLFAKAKNGDLSGYKEDKLLLSKASDYSKMLPRMGTPNIFDKYFLTQLLVHRQFGKVIMLLDRGISLDIKDDKGCSLLQLAVQSGSLVMVNVLLRRGVDVDIANDDGETALHSACRSNRDDIVRVLIENNASVCAQDRKGRTPLYVLVEYSSRDSSEIVNLLINNGAKVMEADLRGITPLHRSSSCDNVQVTKLLIEKGASVHARNWIGETPLHMTSSVEVARVLLQHGASIDAQDKSGQTALHYSVVYCLNQELATFLVGHGASVDIKDGLGETPVLKAMLCSHKERDDYVRLLIENGADCSIQVESDSLLLRAIKSKYFNLQYLIDNGAKVKSKTDVAEVLSIITSDPSYKTQLYVLCKHILKLSLTELAEQDGLETIQRLMPQFETEMGSNYLISCLLELNKMKTTEVYNGFTLNKVFSNYNKLKPKFLREEITVKRLDAFLRSPSLLEQFPMYGCILRNVHKELKQSRFYLLHLSSLSMMKETRKPHCIRLDELAKDRIFKHLSNDDLKNLIKSE